MNGTKWERLGNNDFMLCPKCRAGVFIGHYQDAVAENGFRYCPYCGEDLIDDEA